MRRRSAEFHRKNQLHLPVVIEQDESGVLIVSIPTISGCRSYGHTVDGAMRNITEAAELCLEDESPPSNGTFVGVRDLVLTR